MFVLKSAFDGIQTGWPKPRDQPETAEQREGPFKERMQPALQPRGGHDVGWLDREACTGSGARGLSHDESSSRHQAGDPASKSSFL